MSNYILWVKWKEKEAGYRDVWHDHYTTDNLELMWRKQIELENQVTEMMVTKEIEVIASFSEEEV